MANGWLEQFSSSMNIKWLTVCFFIFISILTIITSFSDQKFPVFIIPLAVGIIPFLALVIYSKPTVISVVLFCFLFFRFHEFLKFLTPLRIPLMLVTATTLSFIINLYRRKISVYWCEEFTILTLILIHVTLGAPFTYDYPNTYNEWLNFSCTCFFSLIITTFLGNRRDFFLMHRGMMISGLFLCFFALRFKDEVASRIVLGDVQSILSDPNDFALTLLLPLSAFVSSFFIREKNRLNQIATIIGLPLSLFVIYSTQSRGGVLGVFATFFFIGFNKSKNKLLYSLIACGTLVALYLIYFKLITLLRYGVDPTNGLDASADDRITAWKAAFNIALHHPLLGGAIGSFSVLFYQYTPTWIFKNIAVHSIWFGILAESGFVGLGLHLWLIFKTFKSNHECIMMTQGVDKQMYMIAIEYQIFLGSFLVAATFLSYAFSIHLYLIMSLILAQKRYLNSRRATQPVQSAAFKAEALPF